MQIRQRYEYFFLDRQFVSPSVLVFFISATPLKPLNRSRISWNFVVIINNEGLQIGWKILIWFFFLGVMSLLILNIRPKLSIPLKQFVSATPLKPLNRVSRNSVVMKAIMLRIFAENVEIIFIRELRPFWT